MKRNTTAITSTHAAAMWNSWAIQDAEARIQARGERMEAWADPLAARWGCVDTVLAPITREALSNR